MLKNKALWLNLLIVFGFGLATFLLWGWGNRPTSEPAWPTQVEGMSFSPLRMENDPVLGLYPTEEQVASDLALLAGQVKAVRTYGLGGSLSSIPRLAEKHGMKVTLGAWLTDNVEENERELERLFEVVKQHKKSKSKTIIQLIVGFTELQPLLYLQGLFIINGLFFALLAVLRCLHRRPTFPQF